MWVPKDNDQDPYNRNNGTPKPVTIGSGAGGSAPIGSGEGNQTNGNPSTVNPVNQIPQQKSATVQDYLGANKAQGNELAGQFKSKLETKAVADKGAIDTSASTIKNQAQAGTTAFNPTVVNAAVKDPTKVANDPAQLQSFLKQWNAAYTGPSTFESSPEYSVAAKAAADAKTKSEQVGEASGRKQILQDEFGVYGQGNKGLDHTLLQNSDEFSGIQDLGKNFASLPDYFTNQAKDVDTATQKGQETTAAAKKNTQDLFSGALTGFQTDLTNRVSSNQKSAGDTVNKIKADLATGDLSKVQATLNSSNLTPAEKSSIQSYLSTLNATYGVKPDLNNYYIYNPATDISAASTASKDDFAKAAALQKLTGVDYSGVLNPADVSKAGTWNNASSGFQGPSLQTYLKSSLGQQDKELLAKGSTADLAAKLNLPDMSQKMNDVGLGQKTAQTLIDAAKRGGEKAKFSPNGETALNPLGQLIQTATRQLVSAANGNGGLNSANIAGLRAFLKAVYPPLMGYASPY